MRGFENRVVLEGAESDTPHLLSYVLLDFSAPPNASILRIGSTRLLLRHSFHLESGKLTGDYKIGVDNYSGFDLRNFCGNVNFIFGMPRGLAFSDGRFFINQCHFTKGFEYYLKRVGTVVDDCSKILRGEVRDYELNELRKSAFN